MSCILKDRGSLVVRSRLQEWRFPSSKSATYVGLVHSQSYIRALQLAWCGSLDKRLLSQASSSSSDHSWKLRGPSQNSPCVASKWTLIKQNLFLEKFI
ncbi:hypothetical protein AVEN_170625-1 [Araneus ventricosus]|uniref:Uncharacterized protein n=1 Tax=Araneus ventricosus TaxID=182803 RepID=A0A4Y2JI18_ARAVE|nr:hypothetical protein AVEN_170625-1 [Araneus ventricosus]